MREVKAVLLHLGLSTEGRALELATRLLEHTAEERKAARARSSGRAPADAGGRGGAPASGGVAADVSRKGAGKGSVESGRVADAGVLEGAPASGGVTTDVSHKGAGKGRAGSGGVATDVSHKGAGKGRAGSGRGSAKGSGRGGSAQATKGGSKGGRGASAKRPPSQTVSPVEKPPPKTHRREQADVSKRARDPATGGSPTMSPPQTKPRGLSGAGSRPQRRLFSGKRVQLTPTTSTAADPGTNSPQPQELNALVADLEKSLAAKAEDTDSDADESLATRRRRFQATESNTSSDEDIPLAHRFMPKDYTFDMLDPGSFAVTAAGEENASDECSFRFKLSRRKLSPPLHMVEVLEVDKTKQLVNWQFWLPVKQHLVKSTQRTCRTFKSVDTLFEANAFRRGNAKLQAWHPFTANDILTCWDKGAMAPTGAIPSGDEKQELLKVARENAE